MKGYHAVPIVADAILKGFKGFAFHTHLSKGDGDMAI